MIISHILNIYFKYKFKQLTLDGNFYKSAVSGKNIHVNLFLDSRWLKFADICQH